jgi:hypothetical protein
MAGGAGRASARAVDVAKLLAFAVAAGGGAFIFDCLHEALPDVFPTQNVPFYLIAQSGLWFAEVGAGIAVGIALAQAWYAKRLGLDLKLFSATLFGFIAGMAAGACGQMLFNSGAQTPLLRTVSWGLMGALLGFSLSFQVPNLGKIRATISGTVGGMVGCIVFLYIGDADLPDSLARMLGVTAVGLGIGAMISLGEGLFRACWLELQFASGEIRQITLGPVPVTIGSDKTRCVVAVAGLPPLAYRFRDLNGRIVCEDVGARQMNPVVSGETLRLGAVRATLYGKQSRVAQTRAPQQSRPGAKRPEPLKRAPIPRSPRHP